MFVVCLCAMARILNALPCTDFSARFVNFIDHLLDVQKPVSMNYNRMGVVIHWLSLHILTFVNIHNTVMGREKLLQIRRRVCPDGNK